MGWIRRLFRTRAGQDSLHHEIGKELHFHIEELSKENQAAGMNPETARHEAMRAFGNDLQIAEDCRRERSVSWLDDFRFDLRFAWRTLFQNPGYTLAAVAALGLGIGPNTAFFTLFNAMVLRPMPVMLSERVVSLNGLPSRFDDFEYYRTHATLFDSISAYVPSHLRMTASGAGAEPVFGLFVSSNYFQVMAADPTVGRSFATADDHQTAAPYPAMLSENFWERRFGRDPQVIGMNMSFSGVQSVIVGINPRDFMGARPEVPDVWLPLGARGPQRTCCVLEGRLKPGVTMQQAQAELNELANSSPSNLPSSQGWRVTVTRAVPGFFAGSKFSSAGPRLIVFTLFQAAIGSVLLIACANVAGLLLSRAVARQKEIAVRLSLGASRGRLVRQLLTEAFVIAQLAGLLSVAMTWWILKLAVRWTLSAIDNAGLSAGGTVLVNVMPDMKVFFYAFGISTITAVGFALLPALQATKINLTESLNNEVPALGGNRRSWLRSWTIGAQVAVCLMLMIAAGTLVRSSGRLLTTDPGFHPDHVLTISILDPAQLGYSANRADAVRHELRDQLSSLPGVESIATASRIPLGGLVTRTTIVPAATASTPDSFRLERYPYSFVSTGYFETLRIPILHGRSLSEQEIANRAPVVVISEALSRNLWPGQDAIGKTVRIGTPAQLSFGLQPTLFVPSVEVVGVARDIYSDSMMRPDLGAFYLPSQEDGWESNIFVRTSGDPNALIGILSADLKSIDNNLSPAFRTMNSVLDHDTGFFVLRTVGIVFSTIGMLGLILASVGIYSMVRYAVGRQKREIGIRMALGAQKADVRRLILVRNMRPIVSGLVMGMLLGAIVSLLLSKVIPGIQFLDPAPLAFISILIAAIAFTATYLPARRATNLDPSSALRSN